MKLDEITVLYAVAPVNRLKIADPFYFTRYLFIVRDCVFFKDAACIYFLSNFKYYKVYFI